MSKLSRAIRRLKPLLTRDALRRGRTAFARRLPGSPSWFEADRATGAILHLDPLIVYVTLAYPDPTSQMRAIASRLPAGPAHFFIFLTWSFGPGPGAERAASELARFRKAYPHYEMTILCNEQSEVDAFKGVGEASILINHNFCVSEKFFFPIEAVPLDFDAVYNARFSPQKRIDLAARIDRVAYITRQISAEEGPSAERRIFASVEALSPRHEIINQIRDDYVVPLGSGEINAVYNRAAVGLCLSPVEGAMLSSMEYLLAGLPIVSVPNLGGRDFYFDPDYCLTVEPDAERIRAAVAELRARAIPREHIRSKTLEKLAPQREAFVALVNGALGKRGVPPYRADPWPWIDRRDFLSWASAENHLRLAAERTGS